MTSKAISAVAALLALGFASHAALARDVPRAASLLTAHLERTSQILLHTAIAQHAPDAERATPREAAVADSSA